MVSCIDVADVTVWETSNVCQHSNLHSTMDHYCGCASTCYKRRHGYCCRFCQSHWLDKNCNTVCCRLSDSKTSSISLTNEVRHSGGSIHTNRADSVTEATITGFWHIGTYTKNISFGSIALQKCWRWLWKWKSTHGYFCPVSDGHVSQCMFLFCKPLGQNNQLISLERILSASKNYFENIVSNLLVFYHISLLCIHGCIHQFCRFWNKCHELIMRAENSCSS